MRLKSMMVVGFAAAAALPAWLNAQSTAPGNVNGFDVFTTQSDGGTVDMLGRLFTPANYDPSKSYPMVVFLAGSGEIGTGQGHGNGNNTSQITSHIDNLITAAGVTKGDFFIYAPQTTRNTWSTDALADVARAVGTLLTQKNIDPNRIYTTGLSIGGEGTIDTLTYYRDMYAAYVPMSESGGGIPANSALAKSAVGKPIWFFHGAADSNGPTPVGKSRDAVNSILAQQTPPVQGPTVWSTASNPTFNYHSPDGTVNYTEYLNGTHGDSTWTTGYGTQAMYDWLLAQHNNLAAPVQGEKIRFSLAQDGVMNNQDSTGKWWNRTGAAAAGYRDPYTTNFVTVPLAMDTAGKRTTVQLEVTHTFFNPAFDAVTKSLSNVYDTAYTQVSWKSSSSNKGQLTFTGLTPGALYDLHMFASVNDSSSTTYNGLYTINIGTANAASQTFDAKNNLTNFIDFAGIVANISGKITLDLAPVAGNNFAVLNSIELSATAVPEPVSFALVAAGSGVLLMRRKRRA